MNNNNASYDEMGRALLRSSHAVRNHLRRRMGVTNVYRPALGRPLRNTWNESQINQAVEMRRQGMSFDDIGEKLGRDTRNVMKKVRYALASPEDQEVLRERTEVWRAREREKRRAERMALNGGVDKLSGRYDKEADEMLRKHWSDDNFKTEDLAASLGRNINSVYARASRLGLRRYHIPIRRGEDHTYCYEFLIEMNDRFCSAMTEAINKGLEHASFGIVTEPSTKTPIFIPHGNYHLVSAASVANECANA